MKNPIFGNFVILKEECNISNIHCVQENAKVIFPSENGNLVLLQAC